MGTVVLMVLVVVCLAMWAFENNELLLQREELWKKVADLESDDRLRSLQEQLSKALEERDEARLQAEQYKVLILQPSPEHESIARKLDELMKRLDPPVVEIDPNVIHWHSSDISMPSDDDFAKRHDEIGVVQMESNSGIYTCPSMPGISFSGSGGGGCGVLPDFATGNSE